MTDCVVPAVLEKSDSDRIPAEPLVSVHMITYNHAAFLAEAIEGIVQQETDFPFELIIGEDCSTDDTRKVAFEYQQKYPHIVRVLYSESNAGQGPNFERVYDACRGKYMAICEGDDCWRDKSKLAQQIDFLSKNNDYVAAYHGFLVKQENDPEKSETFYSARDLSARELLYGGGSFQHSTLCFRNILGKLPENFYRVNGGDKFLRSLLGKHGKGKCVSTIEPSVYRIHDGGSWSGMGQMQQLVKHVDTSIWIAEHHKQCGDKIAAAYFAVDAMSPIAKKFALNKFVFLKWFLKTFFSTFYEFYLPIKNKLTKTIKG